MKEPDPSCPYCNGSGVVSKQDTSATYGGDSYCQAMCQGTITENCRCVEEGTERF